MTGEQKGSAWGEVFAAGVPADAEREKTAARDRYWERVERLVGAIAAGLVANNASADPAAAALKTARRVVDEIDRQKAADAEDRR